MSQNQTQCQNTIDLDEICYGRYMLVVVMKIFFLSSTQYTLCETQIRHSQSLRKSPMFKIWLQSRKYRAYEYL